jgi:hypothetical protein
VRGPSPFAQPNRRVASPEQQRDRIGLGAGQGIAVGNGRPARSPERANQRQQVLATIA